MTEHAAGGREDWSKEALDASMLLWHLAHGGDGRVACAYCGYFIGEHEVHHKMSVLRLPSEWRIPGARTQFTVLTSPRMAEDLGSSQAVCFRIPLEGEYA